MTRRETPSGPVLFEGDDPALAVPAPSVAEAPEVDPAEGAAVTGALAVARGGGGGAGRWLAVSSGGLVSMAVGVWMWDFAAGLLARNAVLGAVAAVLAVVAVAAVLVMAVRELWALRRLARVEALHAEAARALRAADAPAAREVAGRIAALYRNRPGLEAGAERLSRAREELLDADALLETAERECLGPLDLAARREAEAAAGRVAAATAFVPFAGVDVLIALSLNLRMIRRIAEIYGGRAGTLGSWRLLRAVAGHLAATGAVAVGDDLLGPVLGGGALAKLSRRVGEGLVNGALTARVGVAAIEVCRPLPFMALERPRARAVTARALGGFASRGRESSDSAT